MMSGDVSSARSIALRASSASPTTSKSGSRAEDVGDADPEQGVVVDDEDPRRLAGARRSGPPRRRSGPPYSIALICSPLLPSGAVGIASRTTVPPSGRDRTSNRAPISSARSRMNCNPKLRRPRAATAPTSKPRPSSRISRLQSSSAIARRRRRPSRPRVLADILQGLLGHAQGHRPLGVVRRVGRRVQVGRDREPGRARACARRLLDRAVEAELVEHRRAELADERRARRRARVAAARAGSAARSAASGGSVSTTRSMYSTWKIALDSAWAGPSWISWARRDRSASWASTMRIARSPSASRPLAVGDERGVAALQEQPRAREGPLGELEPGQLGPLRAELAAEVSTSLRSVRRRASSAPASAASAARLRRRRRRIAPAARVARCRGRSRVSSSRSACQRRGSSAFASR